MITRNKDELYHYGIKGMKWGVRRAKPQTAVSLAKANYKDAKNEFNRTYNKAKKYSSQYPISKYVNKKKKEESNRLWDDVNDAAEKEYSSRQKYKNIKKERKGNIETIFKDIKKNASLGEKIIYNDATLKLAAKYVVDNNMSMKDAKKKANKVAARNTAILLGIYGPYVIKKFK